MPAARRFALSALLCAVALGIAGDVLLRAQPIGLGVTAWGLALAGAAGVALARIAGVSRARVTLALGTASLFALFLSWRASPMLDALDVAGLAVALGLPLIPQGRLFGASVADYARVAVETGAGVVGGGARLIGDAELRGLGGHLRSARGTAAARGLLVAAPLVVLFGSLFATADAVFGRLLTDATPSLGDARPHGLRIAACAWLAAGVLWLGALRGGVPASREFRPAAALGGLEVALVLGALDLLFAAFVVVQFRAFFGGRSWIESHAGLTFAEYARHGFFQLLAVAGFALAMLLLLDWFQSERTRATQLLAGGFVLLAGAVMVSALERMRLYQREYGLTQLRFYATAFMLWLALVLAWLGVTVVRGRRERFTGGLILSGLAAIVALNVVNPDAVIAQVNIDRAAQGKPVDLAYLGQLSTDAVPALAGRVPARIVRSIAECDLSSRSWNISRVRARDRACS